MSQEEVLAKNVQEENARVYAALASTYDIAHPEIWNWFEQRRTWQLVDAALGGQPRTTKRILDIGAGTGSISLKFLDRGATVLSIDIAPEMLDRLVAKVKPGALDRISIEAATAESVLSRPERYDGICFSSVLHHIFDFEGVLRAAAQSLAPGGFLLSMHDPVVQTPPSRTRFLAHRLLGRIDEAIYKSRMAHRGIQLNDFPDDAVAEYHQSSGEFDFRQILEVLREEGLVLEMFETYVSRRYGVNAWLATNWIGSENSFAILARRT